jgi:DNA-directed RNA polymerase specialized sigma24 family protein
VRQIPFDPEILARMPAGDFFGQEPSPTTDIVRDCVEALPDLYRDVIEMVVYEQINFAEIGRRLGMDRRKISLAYTEALEVLEGQLRHLMGEEYGNM